MSFNHREYCASNPMYTKVETGVEKLVAYVDADSLVLVTFEGRKTKPTLRYKYKSMEEIMLRLGKEIKRIYDTEKAKKEYKEATKSKSVEKRDAVQVGDIFYTSWGYEQTNVDFFQVVAKPSKATVIIREISRTMKEEAFMSGRVSPNVNDFISEEKKCRLDSCGNVSNADRYGHKAYKTSAEADHYCSWYY